jgi:hypothetical protein
MITPLPPAPLRSQPESFASDAETYLSALAPFATEANALASDVNAKQTTASAAANSAIAAQAASEAAANASIWVSGTTYAVGNVRFSPINFKSYRRKTAGAGTTDPSADSTNWQLLTSLGDVDLSSTQTLTNKTISGSSNTITNISLTAGVTGTLPVANGGTGSTTAAGARSNIGAAAATDTVNLTGAQTVEGVKTLSNKLLLSNDGFSFSSDGSTDTGIYWSSDGVMGVICNGLGVGLFSTGGWSGPLSANAVQIATSVLGAGEVGTYAFAKSNTAGDTAFGSTRAGSALITASAATQTSGNTSDYSYLLASGGSLSGTWRCMGTFDQIVTTSGNSTYGATLWLRIS